MSNVKLIKTGGILDQMVAGTAKKEDLTLPYDRSTQIRGNPIGAKNMSSTFQLPKIQQQNTLSNKLNLQQRFPQPKITPLMAQLGGTPAKEAVPMTPLMQKISAQVPAKQEKIVLEENPNILERFGQMGKGALVGSAGQGLNALRTGSRTVNALAGKLVGMDAGEAEALTNKAASITGGITFGDMQSKTDELMQKWAASTERAKQGASPLGRLAVDVGTGAIQLAADIGLGALTGGGAMIPMAARSFGGSAYEAEQAGASLGKQAAYGGLSAGTAVLVERISNAGKILSKAFGKGIADDVLEKGMNKAIGKLIKNEAATGRLAAALAGGVGEGVEEMIESALSPIYQKLTYNPDAKYDADTISDILYDGLVGGIIGGIAGGVGVGNVQAQTQDVAQTPAAIAPALQDIAPQPAQQPTVAQNSLEVKLPTEAQNAAQGIVEPVTESKPAAQPKEQTGPHIDERGYSDVSSRKVNAFQFDNPELHEHYAVVAKGLQNDLRMATKGERFGVKDSDGYYVDSIGIKRSVSPEIEALLDNAKLSYAQIEKGLADLIADHGQENYAAAKKIELVLDDMLTNGYEVEGYQIEPDYEYIQKKEAIKSGEHSNEYAMTEDEWNALLKSEPATSPAQPAIFPENSLGAKITQQSQQTQQAPAPAITPDTMLPDPVNKVVLDRGKKGVDVLGKLQNAYARTVDSQTAIADRFSKDAKDKSGILASNSRNAGGVVNYIFNEGLATRADSGDVKVIGKPLAEVVGEIPKGQEQAFWDYMTQRQNIDRAREGKHLIPNYDSDMSAESVRRIEAANPNFKAIGDNVVNWIDAFMQEWGVGSGLVDAELYNELRDKYKSYFPAQREFDDIEIGLPGDVVNQFVDNKSPIKTATGSARDISNPVENIMNMVNRTVKSAKYNAVGQEIVRSIRKNPDGLSKYAEIIPASVGESSNAANVVTVLEGGKKVYLQVNDQMLLNALKGLPKTTVSVPVASDLVTGFKNVVTQKNPFFAVRNIMRDIPTGYLYGSEGNPLKYIGSTLKAGAEVIKGSDDYTRYRAAGGGASNFFNSKNVETEAKNLTKKPGIIKKALGGIEALNDATETSSRLAEFKRVFEKTGDVQQALYAADSVTVNFARGGDIIKAVDRNAVPYLNAGVQGLDKLVRSFSTPRKAMTMLARGGAMILAPQILTYLMNRDDEDYKSLSNYMKDNYFLIPYGGGHRDNLVGNGKFIKIPKSRELGILFAALPERIMRASKGDEEAYKGLGMSFLTSVSPANPIEDNIFAPATLNLAKNKNFAGSTIVPEYMRRDGRSKHLQHDEKTSELTKAIAKYASKVGVELSPIEMDYLIKSYTGVIGEFILPATTVGGSVGNVVKRQFTADPSFSNQNIVDFYDNLDKATTDSADNKILGKLAPEGADADPLFDKRKGAMETASKRMSELSKISLRAGVNAMSEEDYATLAGYGIESGLDGLELQQALRQKRIEVASEANNLYKNSANDEVALDLYRLTNIGSFEFNDKSYSLTPKEYKRFSELAKTMAPKVIDEASKMSWYKNLDAKQRERVTKDAINFVEDLAKREIVEGRGDEYISDNFEKQYKAYKAGLSPATYFAYKNALKKERPEGGTPSQPQFSRAINTLNLSDKDKGKLWEIQNREPSDKNPFTGTLAQEGMPASESIQIMEAFKEIEGDMDGYVKADGGPGKSHVQAAYFRQWLYDAGYNAAQVAYIEEVFTTWQMIPVEKPSKKALGYAAANPR